MLLNLWRKFAQENPSTLLTVLLVFSADHSDIDGYIQWNCGFVLLGLRAFLVKRLVDLSWLSALRLFV